MAERLESTQCHAGRITYTEYDIRNHCCVEPALSRSLHGDAPMEEFMRLVKASLNDAPDPAAPGDLELPA